MCIIAQQHGGVAKRQTQGNNYLCFEKSTYSNLRKFSGSLHCRFESCRLLFLCTKLNKTINISLKTTSANFTAIRHIPAVKYVKIRK